MFHFRLRNKLKGDKIDGAIIGLLESILSDKRHCICIDGCVRPWFSATSIKFLSQSYSSILKMPLYTRVSINISCPLLIIILPLSPILPSSANDFSHR